MLSNLLVTAVFNEDQSEVRNLIEREDIDVNGYDEVLSTALHLAMERNQSDIVTTLLTSSHLKLITDCFGWNGLHYACESNAFNTIAILGKDQRCTESVINMKDFNNDTAVMVAIRNGNKDCVKEMVKLDGIDLRPSTFGRKKPV